MKDQELFELCKKVYELTGWMMELGDKGYVNTLTDHPRIEVMNQQFTAGWCPLYTSDYLLEKLKNYDLNMYYFHDEGWRYSVNDGDYEVGSDTPIKALLKLTIALHEAGEVTQGKDI
jgi:hypothetical protein